MMKEPEEHSHVVEDLYLFQKTIYLLNVIVSITRADHPT
jgi:hypothetical protein